MYNINALNRQLSYNEYQAGTELFTAMKAAGIPLDKAAAMCYRAGRIDAKREARERRKQYLASKQSPPEANANIAPDIDPAPVEEEEGENNE